MSTFEKDRRRAGLSTQLIHSTPVDTSGFRAQAMPVYRGSSTFFANTAEQRAAIDPLGLDYSYGLHGNPTQFELARQLAHIEQADHCLVTASGLSAIVTTAQALLKSGDHWLIPDNSYKPTIDLAHAFKARYGIDFDLYDPNDPQAFDALLKPHTRLVWLEAPGSITLEVPDIEHMVGKARALGAVTVMDNTWSSGLAFKPFDWGIDVSVQALSKYQAGHADLLMGSIASCNREVFSQIERMHRLQGVGVSPEDCALVLRGLLTLPLRYEAQGRAGLDIARRLNAHPAVDRVLHPGLSEHPDHARFSQLFTGCASVFSFTLRHGFGDDDAVKVVDRLKWFKIGYSWGGPISLALSLQIPEYRRMRLGGGYLIRLAVGLEDVEDLWADLKAALDSLS